MERLLSTPLSPTYMRYALRGLFIWLIMLLAGLVSSGCTSFAKLVVVATAVAYVMLGIDEIGVQIENPFDILALSTPTPGPSRAMWQKSYSVQSLVMTWPVFSGVCVSKLRAWNVGRYALLLVALKSMHSQLILHVHQQLQVVVINLGRVLGRNLLGRRRRREQLNLKREHCTRRDQRRRAFGAISILGAAG